MMNSNSITDIWNNLASAEEAGLTKRRIPVESPLYVYGTYRHPDNLYGIAFSYDSSLTIPVDQFKSLKELEILQMPDTSFEHRNLLLIQLHHTDCLGVFATLCSDLTSAITRESSEKSALRIVLNQLEKWRTLFDRGLTAGLSPAEQQGLYGELHLLSRMIRRNTSDMTETVGYWVGCDKAMRDFQGKDWAIEVKTTATNGSDRLTINGERQLDDALLDRLFLYHLSIEVSRKNGQTLNRAIEDLRKALAADTIALHRFNTGLIHAGYFDEHAPMYQDRCYKIRWEQAYRISGDFPRIMERDLRNGVSNVTYTINTSACEEYAVTDTELFKSTVDHERN